MRSATCSGEATETGEQPCGWLASAHALALAHFHDPCFQVRGPMRGGVRRGYTGAGALRSLQADVVGQRPQQTERVVRGPADEDLPAGYKELSEAWPFVAD